METTDTTTADVKIPKYDQALVVAELKRLSAQASEELGVPATIYGDSASGGMFYVHTAGECTISSIIDNAVAQMAQKIGTPEKRAAKKRELAHRLIIEAQAISPEVAA